jgi:hypothetical protein
MMPGDVDGKSGCARTGPGAMQSARTMRKQPGPEPLTVRKGTAIARVSGLGRPLLLDPSGGGMVGRCSTANHVARRARQISHSLSDGDQGLFGADVGVDRRIALRVATALGSAGGCWMLMTRLRPRPVSRIAGIQA